MGLYQNMRQSGDTYPASATFELVWIKFNKLAVPLKNILYVWEQDNGMSKITIVGGEEYIVNYTMEEVYEKIDAAIGRLR